MERMESEAGSQGERAEETEAMLGEHKTSMQRRPFVPPQKRSCEAGRSRTNSSMSSWCRLRCRGELDCAGAGLSTDCFNQRFYHKSCKYSCF